jgi:hypothetical protein
MGDAERFLDGIRGDLAHGRALIVFAAGTELRQGECFGVTVDRVDFLRRHVGVDRQLIPAVPNRQARRALGGGRRWVRWRVATPAISSGLGERQNR